MQRKLADHPTVRKVRRLPQARSGPPTLTLEELQQACLEAGADDAGVVSIDREELASERGPALEALPGARTFVSFVLRMSRDALRSPPRSVANLEFHDRGHDVNETGRRIAAWLVERGARAIHPAMGFPMEADRFPGRIWVVSHKPVAEAAGLGKMGIHRSVIHPRFGSHILLGTVITDAEVAAQSAPLDFDPCLSCRLCVAACPVGAIKPDGAFDFSACYTHNYREFMSGYAAFNDEAVQAKGDVARYRERVPVDEQVSMWQSLSFGAQYKAAYCLAVCPAGEDVIAPFLDDRPRYVRRTVEPLTGRAEKVYVVPNSDAEAHVRKRFPHKTPRAVDNGLRPRTVDQLLRGMPLSFQRGKSRGLDATYHLTFTGREERQATVRIAERKLAVREGHHGEADVRLTADTDTWLGVLAGEKRLVWALLTRRVRVKGDTALLKRFAACFA